MHSGALLQWVRQRDEQDRVEGEIDIHQQVERALDVIRQTDLRLGATYCCPEPGGPGAGTYRRAGRRCRANCRSRCKRDRTNCRPAFPPVPSIGGGPLHFERSHRRRRSRALPNSRRPDLARDTSLESAPTRDRCSVCCHPPQTRSRNVSGQLGNEPGDGPVRIARPKRSSEISLKACTCTGLRSRRATSR